MKCIPHIPVAPTSYDLTGLSLETLNKIHALVGKCAWEADTSDLYNTITDALGHQHVLRVIQSKYDNGQYILFFR